MKLHTINELVNCMVSLNATQSKKAADISHHHQYLPCKMTSERKKRPQKSILLTCNYPAYWVVFLIGFSKFNFPHSTTNQKHFPNMPGSNVISMEFLRSFLRRLVSRGNQCWCHVISAVFSGYMQLFRVYVGRSLA